MGIIKTPGVYIVENNDFPNSVVEAATAVPAFIGYTEKAQNGSRSLINMPFRISSLAEYEQYFGKGPNPDFSLVKTDYNNLGISAIKDISKLEALENLTNVISKIKEDTENAENTSGTSKILSKLSDQTEKLSAELAGLTKPEDLQYYSLIRNDKFNFYYQLQFFFKNGGGPCYIVSVDEGYKSDSLSYEAFAKGIECLLKEQEPTILVIPEAVYLDDQQCYDLQKAMVNHCGNTKNRIAILDIYNGNKPRKDPDAGDIINIFREKIGNDFLNYAAAYYPWLNTTIVSENNLNINAISNVEDLRNILKTEAVLQKDNKSIQRLLALSERVTKSELQNPSQSEELHKILLKVSAVYASIVKEMVKNINLLPPSSALAGIYTLVDNTKEVWKAPANIGLSTVVSPAVDISHSDQEDLNVPLNGKAINAIRYFVGLGVNIWGARTLDSNSMDWRYINVRRTMIMLEQSIKNAVRAFVFEPNTANTWVSVRSVLENFLYGIWKRGGLAGAVPSDAYSVYIGLGETMTPDDILEGIMRITVKAAIVRPAEFIEITFQQQMQKN